MACLLRRVTENHVSYVHILRGLLMGEAWQCKYRQGMVFLKSKQIDVVKFFKIVQHFIKSGNASKSSMICLRPGTREWCDPGGRSCHPEDYHEDLPGYVWNGMGRA